MPYIECEGKKLLFIHIPKTGGTSIEESMKAAGAVCFCSRAIPPSLKVPPEHFTWNDYSAFFPEGYFDYAFAIIRNPYERIESEYRMRAILNKQGLWGATERFSVWLANSLNQAARGGHFLANHFRPQVEFLGSGVRIFRYEDGLENALNHVAREAGVRIGLTQQRFLSGGSYGQAIAWDAQDIHAVNEFYRADFRELGYEERRPGFNFSA
ncbi:MAG: sulfotransferase family 2 domain-containing protein [Rhodocyclales bacterium]|nr:sulfotransferase family 2 domain-containing protein [Rhodocyclales bacterium]